MLLKKRFHVKQYNSMKFGKSDVIFDFLAHMEGGPELHPMTTGVRQNFATNVKSAWCVCEATASSARALAHIISTLGTSAPSGDRD